MIVLNSSTSFIVVFTIVWNHYKPWLSMFMDKQKLQIDGGAFLWKTYGIPSLFSCTFKKIQNIETCC